MKPVPEPRNISFKSAITTTTGGFKNITQETYWYIYIYLNISGY